MAGFDPHNHVHPHLEIALDQKRRSHLNRRANGRSDLETKVTLRIQR
jgi:hypothetical protein